MFRGYDVIKALAKSHGVRVADLLVLAETNDPFYVGNPAQRAKAEWFAHLWARFGYTTGVHLRRVHDRLVSGEDGYHKHDGMPYENTEACWDYLGDAGKYARDLGLVRPDAFEDHRNPPPHIHMAPTPVQALLRVQLSDLDDWRLPWIESDLSTVVSSSLPIIDIIDGHTYAPSDQPPLVDIWIEKSTMDDVPLPLCDELHSNLGTSVGFPSTTSTSYVEHVEVLAE